MAAAEMEVEDEVPDFAPVDTSQENKQEYQAVFVPSHRYTPLRQNWAELIQPLIEELKINVRFDSSTRQVSEVFFVYSNTTSASRNTN